MKHLLVIAVAVLACSVTSSALATSTAQYAGQTPQQAISTAQLSIVALAAAFGGKSDLNTVAALERLLNVPGYTATKSMCAGKQAWAVRAPRYSALQNAEYHKALLQLEPKLATFSDGNDKQSTAPIMVTSAGAQLSCT